MFDKISFIGEQFIFVNLMEGVDIKSNILSSHVVISDAEKNLLGEIVEIGSGKVKINGEYYSIANIVSVRDKSLEQS